MGLQERLLSLTWERGDEDASAETAPHLKEKDLCPSLWEVYVGLEPVDFGFLARDGALRYEDVLASTQLPSTEGDVLSNRGVSTHKVMLLHETDEDAPGCMPLFSRCDLVVLQDGVDDLFQCRCEYR